MENYYDIEGININSIDYKENNKILKVFTKELGVISVMYQNRNKYQNQFDIGFDLFAMCKFDLIKGKNFYYLQDIDLIKSNFYLREDVYKNAYATVIIDFIKNIMFEESPDEKIYGLVIKTIDMLKYNYDVIDLLNAFMIKVTAFLGVQPILDNCIICGANKKGAYRFSIDIGGIICDNCKTDDYFDTYLNDIEIRYLKYLLYNKLEKIEGIKIDKSSKIKIRKLLSKYLIKNFDIKEFNSIKFLNYLD